MLRLIDPMKGLPGGWKYVVPETGYVVSASNYNALINKIFKHREANNLSTDNFIEAVEHALCLSAPEGCCTDGSSPRIYASVPTSSPKCCKGKKIK